MLSKAAPAFLRPSRAVVWLAAALWCAGCADSGASSPAGVDSSPGSPRHIEEPYLIEVTGEDYRWQVRYPGSDGRLGTDDDVLSARHVHVPLETDVVLVLKSTDYVYLLALPLYGVKEIAVPDLEFRVEFHPREPGRFELLGDELCGKPHPELQGELVVEPPERFLAWLDKQKSTSSGPSPPVQ